MLPSFCPRAECCHKWYLDCPRIPDCWHLNRLSFWIHLQMSIPTFISNMGGTNVGRASLSVTRLCLWAVWPEQNVNLFRSSCLRQTCDKENRKQNIISVKSINILNVNKYVRLGKYLSNLKSFPSSIFPSEDWISIWSLGTSSREKLLPARPETGSSSSKLYKVVVIKTPNFHFPVNLNLWLTLASTFLTLPQSSSA